jgi:hypothetical protein
VTGRERWRRWGCAIDLAIIAITPIIGIIGIIGISCSSGRANCVIGGMWSGADFRADPPDDAVCDA